MTEEGYITNIAGTPVYHYYLKDHQGNNRVVIDNNGTVEQVNHYYPFGGLFSDNTGGDAQPYKYNGKELDCMHGLDLFDYGARHYDAAIGRWGTVDPLAEKYYSISPYAYVANNPLRFIDPDGRQIQQPWSFKKRDRFFNSIAKTNEASSKALSASVSASTSIWSAGIKGEAGGITVEGNVGLGNVTGKVSTENFSVKGNAIKAEGKLSVSDVVSAKASATLAESKVSVNKNLDINTEVKGYSINGSVEIGKEASVSVDEKATVGIGAKISIIKAEFSINMKAAGEWLGGIAETIGIALTPEIKVPEIEDKRKR